MPRTISTSSSTGITLTSTSDNPVSVAGTGTITVGTGSALYGRGGGGNTWTITNSGLISSTDSKAAGIQLGSGVNPVTSSVITNQPGGTIAGGYNGIKIDGSGSVTNTSGSISGTFAIAVYGDGHVTNTSGGTISGSARGVYLTTGTISNLSGGYIHGSSGAAAFIYGYGQPGNQTDVLVYNAATLTGSSGVIEYSGGSVTNAAGATITGTSDTGIDLGGNGTVVNAGVVSGSLVGVDMYEGGSLTNLAGSTITGGNQAVYFGANGGTFTNAGTVAGSANAVNFSAYGHGAYRLIADPGAVFDGAIYGGQGVLELAPGSSTGTLYGFGSTITNFSTLQFDQGASWGISGDAAGLGAIGTIAGFAGGDTIDLTDFAATGATFAGNALTLTNTSDPPVTLNVAGTFTSADFRIAPDGASGTDVSLQPRTFAWTGVSADWNTPSAWDLGSVPSPGDNAVIDAAGTPYVVSVAGGDTDAVADLTLDASNATVEVAGTLAAAGTVAVTGGTLDVPGVLRAGSIIDGALLTFHGNFTLDDTPLALGGTLQVSSSSGATFTLGTGEVVTQNGLDALIANGGTIGNTLVNQGSIDAGVAGGTMTIAVPHVVNQGTIAVSNGDTLDVSSAVDSGSGTIEVGGSGIADFATSVDAGQTLDFADASGILKLRAPASFAASIANFVPGDTIDLPGIAADSATWSTGQLTIGNAGTSVAMLSLPGDYSSDAFTVASDGGGGSQVTVTATCYAAGTRIATPRGEVPIERLHRDDLVQTISGRPQRISWIGHRRVDFRRHPNRRRILPVRIAANAFGPGRPKRNLLLSPDHAVFVEGVLIPIRHLINGANVVQLERHSITYYHIELPRHDVLIAEGMPAESYLEAGARGAFGNGDMVIQLHPDFTPPQDHYAMLWEQYGYAPLVMAGEAVERVRDLLSRNRYAA